MTPVRTGLARNWAALVSDVSRNSAFMGEDRTARRDGLRIAIVHNSMSMGGQETSLLALLRYLGKNGYRVDLYLGRPEGPLMASLPPEVNLVSGIPQDWLLRVFSSRPIREILGNIGLSTPRDLARYLAYRVLRLAPNPWIPAKRPKIKYDLAIAYGQAGFAPRFVIDRVDAARKVMWWHHGKYEATARNRRRDARYYQRLDAVVAVAEPTRRMIIDNFPQLTGRVQVIPNIVEHERIRELSTESATRFLEDGGIRIVTVGRLHPEKGMDLAVKAASVLHEAGYSFDWYIIGDGHERGWLQELSIDLGVDHCLHFLGYILNPFPYIGGTDIYVQPSRVEAHPLGILEAMALSKPIVACGIPAIRAVMEDQDLGILVECSEAGIAEGVARFIDNPQLRAAYVSRLRQLGISETAQERIDALLEWRIEGFES